MSNRRIVLNVKRIYLYLYLFALIYIEFGYRVVVANLLPGNVRLLILLLFTILLPVFGSGGKANKKSFLLLLFFILIIFFNCVRDLYFNDYIILLIPICCAFMLTRFYSKELIVEIFYKIVIFLAIFSLITFIISFLAPSIIRLFPYIGNRYTAQMYDSFFSVNLLNTSYFRNYGLAWEPGAFAILLLFAMYINLFVMRKDKIFDFLILTIAIITTFSTMGYITMLGLFFIVINRKDNIKKASKRFILFSIVLIMLLLVLVPYIDNIVFSKLSGLFSDSTKIAYTTSTRIDAITYTFDEFIHHPLFGLGYVNFNDLNRITLFGLATNTIMNWFCLLGCVFAIPCVFFFFKSIVNNDFCSFRLFEKIFFIVFFSLMLSTESLLRISLPYIIIFLGCRIEKKEI